MTLFASKGYGATGIRDIARAAGLTSATLYHYTSAKEELLIDIMIEGQSALNRAAMSELEGVTRPEHRLAVLVGGLVATHATNPLSSRVVDTEIRSLPPDSLGRKRVVALRDEYEKLWAAALDQGITEGVFDIGDPHATRLALITMCTGMSNWYRPGAGEDPITLAAEFIDLVLGAIRAKRGRRVIRGRDLPTVRASSVPVLPFEPLH